MEVVTAELFRNAALWEVPLKTCNLHQTTVHTGKEHSQQRAGRLFSQNHHLLSQRISISIASKPTYGARLPTSQQMNRHPRKWLTVPAGPPKWKGPPGAIPPKGAIPKTQPAQGGAETIKAHQGSVTDRYLAVQGI